MPLYGLSVPCVPSRPVDDDVVSSKRKENTHRKHCEIGDYTVFVSGCVKGTRAVRFSFSALAIAELCSRASRVV
jgi:hypothetical protein